MKPVHFLVPLVMVLLAGVAVGAAARAAGSPPSMTSYLVPRTSYLAPLIPPIFGPNVKANADATTFGQHEPSLAVSRVDTNTVVVAQKDYRVGNQKQVWIETSTDGGATWPVGRQLQMPGINGGSFPNMSDAVVMARDDGRMYVACLAYNNSNAIFITWSTDGGATWVPSVQISPTDGALDDKDWFAIDSTPSSPYYHRMYMMYAPGANNVVEQHSTDGGATWSTRQGISTANTEYTYPVVGRDGTVYNFMMFNWGGGQTGSIQLTKSTNGGVSWSAPAGIVTAYQPPGTFYSPDQFRFFSIISAAVDPNNDALYAAWTQDRGHGTTSTEVMYVKSTDHGATWTAPIRLSHDPTSGTHDHITPMITVGADSRIHAFWLDRRLDASNHLWDSWYSSSTDGGATWDADTRVSTVSQDLNIGFPPGSGNAAGDYWGLDTWRDSVYVAWNDTRDGVQQDIYVAKGLMYPGGGGTPTVTPPVPTTTRTATRTVTIGPTNTSPPQFTPTRLPSATNTLPPQFTPTPPPGPTNTPGTPSPQPTSTTTPLPTLTCPPVWRDVLDPPFGTLHAVSADASDDAWAVGDDGAIHWNGNGWQPPQGGSPPNLTGVAAIAPNDVWAVGNQSGFEINHWNGSTWTPVPHPTPGGSPSNSWEAVAAGATNSVWAVGESFYSGQPMIEHWNGTAWSVICPPCTAAKAPPAGASLLYLPAVDAVDAGSAWVVGYSVSSGVPLAYACSTASCVPSTTGLASTVQLHGVSALSATSVWAVGYNAGGSYTAHWNGTTWNAVPAPNVGPLHSVKAIASTDVWAVGDNGILHWGGGFWAQVPANAAQFYGVDASGPTDVWAVGVNNSVSRIEHTSGAQQYQDVPLDYVFYPYIRWMTCHGYISGYTCGTPEACVPPDYLPYFRPASNVTRGQLLKMVVNAAGWTLINPPDASRTFEDVHSSYVFYPYIETGYSHGIISGYLCGQPPAGQCQPPNNRPYFLPDANITRGQLSKVISLAKGYTDAIPTTQQTFADVPPTHTFWVFIERVYLHTVVSGYTGDGVTPNPCTGQIEQVGQLTFRPCNNATRGQVTKFVTLAYGGP